MASTASWGRGAYCKKHGIVRGGGRGAQRNMKQLNDGSELRNCGQSIRETPTSRRLLMLDHLCSAPHGEQLVFSALTCLGLCADTSFARIALCATEPEMRNLIILTRDSYSTSYFYFCGSVSIAWQKIMFIEKCWSNSSAHKSHVCLDCHKNHASHVLNLPL